MKKSHANVAPLDFYSFFATISFFVTFGNIIFSNALAPESYGGGLCRSKTLTKISGEYTAVKCFSSVPHTVKIRCLTGVPS